ncbi:hypothetical protein BDN70DRAFT_900754 [Pholiota conissans]|uniref:Uncharacterized protein n=1 Tax=Pholiota conissans TaxID=109636 RepID=A0A9P5YNM8_9AGAR|nr:hypothetical protein BDN70DRAFT_900754 [Pholiota conissans]
MTPSGPRRKRVDNFGTQHMQHTSAHQTGDDALKMRPLERYAQNYGKSEAVSGTSWNALRTREGCWAARWERFGNGDKALLSLRSPRILLTPSAAPTAQSFTAPLVYHTLIPIRRPRKFNSPSSVSTSIDVYVAHRSTFNVVRHRSSPSASSLIAINPAASLSVAVQIVDSRSHTVHADVAPTTIVLCGWRIGRSALLELCASNARMLTDAQRRRYVIIAFPSSPANGRPTRPEEAYGCQL